MSWLSRITKTLSTFVWGADTEEEEQKNPLIEQAQVKLVKSQEQEKQHSKNKAPLWYVAHEQMKGRARFGAHGAGYLKKPLDLFSVNETLKSTLSHEKVQVEKKIKELIREPLGNKSISFLDKKNVLNQLSHEDGLKYQQLWKQRKKIVAELDAIERYQNENTEWKKWFDGKIPSESVRDQIIHFAVDSALGQTYKIPVIGGLVTSSFSLYSRFKLSIWELISASNNLFSHTRRKLAIGRILGVVGGTIIGAAVMGGALSLAGSVVPGIGSAAGGVAGIVLGAIAGAQKGGPMGLKAFQFLSQFSDTLQDEYNYQMDYVHLAHLKKIYGFDYDKILKMYSYLNNQIKRVGLKTEEGVLLNNMKVSALEEGRQNALTKLCVYFIGQEKCLRTELYQIGILSVNNQKQKNDLLNKRRSLHSERLRLDEIQKKREAEIDKNPFFIKLKEFKKKNHISYTDKYLFEYFLSTPEKNLSVQDIQAHFGLRSQEAINFIGMMKKNTPDFEKNYGLINDDSKKKWLKKWKKNEKSLIENEDAFLQIQNKRYELESDRDNIVEILGEYQRPSHFVQGNNNIWVYEKIMGNEDPIGKLFEPINNEIDSPEHDARRPKNVRAFGAEGYTVHGMETLEKEKAEFREDMRANAFERAKAEATQREESFWAKGFQKSNKNVMRKHLVTNNEQLNALEVLFERIDLIEPHLAKVIHGEEKEVDNLNDACKRIIFDLQKSAQNFPELSDLIQPKIKALQDIQFYLGYAAINQVYIRRDLAQVQESPLLDLFPYTEYGMVEHLIDEDKGLVDIKDQSEVLSRMEEGGLSSRVLSRFDTFVNNNAFTPEKFEEAWHKIGQLDCKPEFDLVLKGLADIKKLQETYKRSKKDDGYLEPKFLYGIMIQANELSHRLNNNLENLSRRALQNEEMRGAAPKDGIVRYLDLIRACQSKNAVAEMFETSVGHSDIQQLQLAAALFREKPNTNLPLATSKKQSDVPSAMVDSNAQRDGRFMGLFEQQKNKRGRLSDNRTAVPLIGFAIKPAALSFDAVIQEAKAFPSFESVTQLGNRFEFTFENVLPKLIIQTSEDGAIEIFMEISEPGIMAKAMDILKAQISGYANCVKKDDDLPKEITVLAGKNQEHAELVYFHSKESGLNPELQSEQLGKNAVREIENSYSTLIASEQDSLHRAKQKGK